MYLLSGEWWPKKDPITNRTICHACWNLVHSDCGNLFDTRGQINCDHAMGSGVKRVNECKKCSHECDCIHLSEATWAQQEKAQATDNKRAKTVLLHEMRDDPDNLLRAINDKYRGA